MSVDVRIRISARAWRLMSRAAREHDVSLPEHLRLVIEADAAVYAVEDSDRTAAGPIATQLRPRRWRQVVMMPHEPTRSVTAAFFGDPPPGRSALDQKKVQV
ncbi:MAG TPA: hypothetical protein VGN75_04220 [Kaistia sp.]|nr:hypothetical protein [Kaistia sp.]